MSSARNEDELLAFLNVLVRENAQEIFGIAPDGLRVEELELGRAHRHKGDRHQRALLVRLERDGVPSEKRIWLKFVTLARSRYDAHLAAWSRTRDVRLFPQPYFFHEDRDGGGVIGMEMVEGPCLRDLFLRRTLTRRTAPLGEVFRSLGASLRTFHDSSRPSGFKCVGDLAEDARRLAASTEYLNPSERDRLVALIDVAAEQAGGVETSLPLITVHHDCTLRNVVVRRDGSPCLVDLDSMRTRPNSRWHDVGIFLINLESQMRYAPLGNARTIAPAWRSFWSGYAQAALPDGVDVEQARALVFLTKAELLVGAAWRPLFQIYTGFPASRYMRRLKKSVLRGEHLAFEREAVAVA